MHSITATRPDRDKLETVTRGAIEEKEGRGSNFDISADI